MSSRYDVGTPRIVGILAAVGLAFVANQYAPGMLQAVLILVVLYVALVHAPRWAQLVNTVPNTLGAAFRGSSSGGAGGGGGRVLIR